MENTNMAIEFTERLDQLIKDGKGEVQAFDITADEFQYKIIDFNLDPLRYLFLDLSMVEFKEGNEYFYL